MKKECGMKTFLQLLRLGDAAADTLSKFAIRTRSFSRKNWAQFIQITHKINIMLFVTKLEIAIGIIILLESYNKMIFS